MAMESNLNLPDSLYDNIHYDSSPYFLESPPVPASTAFEYVSNSGMLPGSEGIPGGLGDSFEEIAANSNGQSTQYSQGTLNSVEFPRSFSGTGSRNEVGDDPSRSGGTDDEQP